MKSGLLLTLITLLFVPKAYGMFTKAVGAKLVGKGVSSAVLIPGAIIYAARTYANENRHKETRKNESRKEMKKEATRITPKVPPCTCS